MVRADSSFIENPMQQSLLVTFMKALYDIEFTDICKTSYSFELTKGPAIQLGQLRVEILEDNMNENATPWMFETKPEVPR